jgi:hypothetical protein
LLFVSANRLSHGCAPSFGAPAKAWSTVSVPSGREPENGAAVVGAACGGGPVEIVLAVGPQGAKRLGAVIRLTRERVQHGLGAAVVAARSRLNSTLTGFLSYRN